MRAVLCIYYKISPIPINKFKNANFYSSLRKTYNQPWSTTAKWITIDISALQCIVHCKFNLLVTTGDVIMLYMIKSDLFVAPMKIKLL